MGYGFAVSLVDMAGMMEYIASGIVASSVITSVTTSIGTGYAISKVFKWFPSFDGSRSAAKYGSPVPGVAAVVVASR